MAIDAETDTLGIQTHFTAAPPRVDITAPDPVDDKAVAELVPIGQPGGLHAREQQREMTARQRLERERRAKAKERQEAAEAAAKAAAVEIDRAAAADAAADAERAAAEEAAVAAMPSIELGAPGGLHAKIQAEKAMGVLLPSAEESRARLKRSVHRT